MNNLIYLLAILSITLVACENSPQYDVYVSNKTDGDLTISYKSEVHQEGSIEEAISLKSGEQKNIISTFNLHLDSTSAKTQSLHCSLVADYVYAKNAEGKQATLKWCDQEVGFSVVDVGQGEFLMEFKNEHF